MPRLYLLDTNLPENEERWLTDRLYSGGTDERIAQEMILGVAGVRALRALSLPVEIYHFNEGHAVLAGLELIREKMSHGLNFHEAWRQTRPQIVFTTHTPVPEGNEAHHFGALHFAEAGKGFTDEQLREIGGEPFNMTVAGLRLARKANAVSQLHAETAAQMWRGIQDAAPIIGITNGVHPGTWQDPLIARAFEAGEELWESHQMAKQNLLRLIAARNGVHLRPDALLIGFARRAAPYKRGDLILSRP